MYYPRIRSFFLITTLKNFNVDSTLLFNSVFFICPINGIYIFFLYLRSTPGYSLYLFFMLLYSPLFWNIMSAFFCLSWPWHFYGQSHNLGYSNIPSWLNSCCEFSGCDTVEIKLCLLYILRLIKKKHSDGLITNQLQSFQSRNNV